MTTSTKLSSTGSVVHTTPEPTVLQGSTTQSPSGQQPPLASQKISSAPHAGTTALFEEPYAALLPRFQALRTDDLSPVNIDVPSAVTTALGVAPELLLMKERVMKDCPNFDTDPLERLDTYAMALSHAHTLYLMASQPADALAPLAKEGTKLRETLYADASALVQRELLNRQQLRDLQGPVGYKNLAFDLQILAALFRENITALQGKCATQPAEIRRADEIAASMLRTVGQREQGPASVAVTADLRARAFTIFVRAYDQVRRVVTYLHWDADDVDSIIPSLYAGRGGSKKKATDVVKPATSPAEGTTAAQTGAAPVAHVAPAATSSHPTAPATNGTSSGPFLP